MSKINTMMNGRLDFESKMRSAMGFSEHACDTLRTKWMIISHETQKKTIFELDQIYLMVSKDH